MKYTKYRAAAVMLVLLAAAWLLFRIWVVFIPFILGFLLAYILNPLVQLFEERNIPRVVAIVLVYLLLGAVIFLLIYYALPILFSDIYSLIDYIPQYTKSLQGYINELQINYSRFPMPETLRQITDELIVNAEKKALIIGHGLLESLLNLFTQLFNLILTPILSFYFLLEFNKLGKLILELLPVRYRAELEQIGTEINQVIKSLLRGNLLVSLLVGTLAVIGMSLVGMDFPLLIGVMVGITNFIPYFGAIISTIPAVLLALIKSKWLALYVLGLMIVIQQIEGNIISPKILGACVGLHPLVIVLALLIGGELWGLLGMLLAVPLAAVLKILFKHLYLHLV